MMKTGFSKRLTLAAFLFLPAALLPGVSRAVPANRAAVETAQPDGTRIRIALKGDEFSKRHEDDRGYTILKDTATAAWVYAEQAPDGSLRAGSYRVGAHDPARLGLSRHLKDRRPAGPSRTRGTRAASGPSRAPVLTGTLKNLVILARFSDQAATYTQAQFESLFNTANYAVDGATGSVRDFYLQASRNALVVQSTVSPWVALPQPYAYYGINDGSGFDTRPKEMVADAINALDAAGFDFSPFDGNGDGVIDGLTIIHSGRGEETAGNDSSYIWSHYWSLDAPITKDGVSMQAYHTEPELRGSDANPATWGITRIGVICHELGHALGLPDLYDTGGDSAGAGQFCLMAEGSWNGADGTSPAHPSAWCKKELAWTAPIQLSTTGAYSLARVEDNANSIYLLQAGAFPSLEYFLVENRQGYGFDSALPGTSRGLLIWHVDETRADNDDQTRYLVGLKQADGLGQLEANTNGGDDGDYFRLGNNASFGDTTTPDSNSHAGIDLGLLLWSISASSDTMTFNLSSTAKPALAADAYPRPWKPGTGGSHDAAGITFAPVPDNTTIRIYTLTGELVKELTALPADLNAKVWDGRNTAGKKAASGVYFCHLAAAGYTPQFLKLAIER